MSKVALFQRKWNWTRALIIGIALGASPPAVGEETLVAVATNFLEVSHHLGNIFQEETQHRLRFASGATGQLYAQITQGAPFDVLLAADQVRPLRLEIEGYAVSDSYFIYALGRLTLWSPQAQMVGANGVQTLSAGRFRVLAIANPALAPYGVAAQEMLRALGLWDRLRGRFAIGQNIGQAFAMVATGNAELGLVALSSVISQRNPYQGSRWDVPDTLYMPIRQGAVLLMRAADNRAARDFLAFLKTAPAKAVITEYGYGVN